MERFDSKMAVDVGMQNGDIAITDNPFGIGTELPEVDAVDDPDGAVASP